jgi:DUF4097 and DUF4098 domain-containing protein YvlB
VAPGGRLELINVNGRITAELSESNKIEVVAVRKTKASSDEAARELMDKIELREEVGDSRVRVEVRPPRLSGFSSHEFKWTVKVPEGVHVDLRTVNGGVSLNGLSGEVRAKATNGGVTAEALKATRLEASAVNGGINLEFAAPLDSASSVDAVTVNGDVALRLLADSKATIDARCVNGNVNYSDTLSIQRTDEGTAREKRRHLAGTLNGGGAQVKLKTVNGGVRIGVSEWGRKPTT